MAKNYSPYNPYSKNSKALYDLMKDTSKTTFKPQPIKGASFTPSKFNEIKPPQNATSNSKPSFLQRLQSGFGKTVDFIARPIYAFSNVALDAANKDSKFTPWQSFKSGIKAQTRPGMKDALNALETNYSVHVPNPVFNLVGRARGKSGDELKRYENAWTGFMLELMLPPSGVLVGGLTKTGKLANIASKGQTVREGSKIAEQIAKLQAKNPIALKYGDGVGEQADLGQRALLQYWGIPLVKGKPVFKGASAVAPAFNKVGQAVPLAGRVLPALASKDVKDFKYMLGRSKAKERAAVAGAKGGGQELIDIQKELVAKGYDPTKLYSLIEKRKKGTIAPTRFGKAGDKYKVKNTTEAKLDEVLKAIKPEVDTIIKANPAKLTAAQMDKIKAIRLAPSPVEKLNKALETIKPAVDKRVADIKASRHLGKPGSVYYPYSLSGQFGRNGASVIEEAAAKAADDAHWKRVVGLDDGSEKLAQGIAKKTPNVFNIADNVGLHNFINLPRLLKEAGEHEEAQAALLNLLRNPAIAKASGAWFENPAAVNLDNLMQNLVVDIGQPPVPNVAKVADQVAGKQGYNLGQLMDEAVNFDPFAKAKDDNHWRKVVGLTDKKKMPKGVRLGTWSNPDLSDLSPQAADFVKRIWNMNESNLARLNNAGVKISDLEARRVGQNGEKLNYMMHYLHPKLRDKLAKNKIFSLLKLTGNRIKPPMANQRGIMGTAEDINEQARQGILPGYEGKKFADGMFLTDPAAVQTYSNVLAEQMIERANFLGEVATKWGEPVMKSADGTAVVKDGYRVLDSPQFAGKLENVQLPEEIADLVESKIRILSNPDEMDKISKWIGRLFDNAQGIWKITTLLPIPSYHIRNATGNFWMNSLGGVPPWDAAYKKSVGVLKGTDGVVKTAAGNVFTNKQIRELMESEGVLNKGWFAYETGLAELDKLLPHTRNIVSKVRDLPGIRTGAKVQETMENWARAAHFIKKLEEGFSPEQAAVSVKKFLFDPENISDFERVWMRRIFPFYTWSRHNIPLQLERFAASPGKFARVNTAITNVERNAEQQYGRPNELMMPRFLAEGLPVYYGMRQGLGDNPVGRYAMLKFWYPGADIQQAFQPHEWAGENLTPFAKVPVEMLMNKSLYFEDEIERYPGEVTSFLGQPMPERFVYGLRSGFRLGNEIDKLNPGNMFGNRETQPTQTDRWKNFLTGMKLYNYDPLYEERIYGYENDRNMNMVGSAIERAEREGNMRLLKELMKRENAMLTDPRTEQMYMNDIYYKQGYFTP